MRALRRAGVAACTVALVAASSSLPAADAAPADWAGSEAQWAPTVATDQPTVTARFKRAHTSFQRLYFQTTLVAVGQPPEGCGFAVSANSPDGAAGTDVTTTATATTSCSGVFDVRVRAELRSRDLSGRWTVVNDAHEVARQMAVDAPPPQVTGLSATPGDGRTVELAWDDLRPAAPDLVGYVVEREASEGWTVLGQVGTSPTSFVDADPPAGGGDVRYRVSAQRPRADGTPQVGGAQEQTAVAVPAQAGGGDDPQDDPTVGGDGTGTITTGGGDDGATTPTSARGRRATPPSSTRRSPRIATPSRRAPTMTPTTDPGSYEMELPYDAVEPGEEAAALPSDLTSTEPIDQARRGLLVPVAIALVLAAWAVHLRYFSRLARPRSVPVDDLPGLPPPID